MGTFSFQAKAESGKFVKGEVEAGSETEARIKIRAQKLAPLQIVPKRGSSGAKAASGAGFSLFREKVKAKELQIFTRQFAVLVGAGVPIVQSLQAMVQGARSPALIKALTKVLEEVEKGKRLAEALATAPHVFDKMYINLVRAGEEGGVLETVLNRLAEYIEKSVKLRGKIVSAMWYPAAIIVVAFAVIAGIMVFVIPKFVSMFSQSGKQLPALTEMVIKMSHLFTSYWWAIVLVMIAVPFIFRTIYETDEGKKSIDPILIEIPVLGNLIQKGAIARMSRTLSTLLAAGVRILDALDISATTAGNWVVERAIINAKDSVSKGKSLTEPLRKESFMPNMVLQMISVGEQTGNMDAMLSKIADFYEGEVESASEALTSLLEPMLMVFLGGIIAVLVIAMYLPIFNLASAVTG